MSKGPFHTALTAEGEKQWSSVKAYVLGQSGIQERMVGTAENFVTLANKLYGLDVSPDQPFAKSVSEMFLAISQMPKSARRRLRKANMLSLGYEVRPASPSIRKKAKKKHLLRKSEPSPGKVEAREAYRAKHLVMVTKDGQALFGNVKEHSSKEAREAFYKSWEWRTARMEVLKRHERRCMCCGSTPDDKTVDGKPVRLVVDHIKPVSRYWHLRLAQPNLQILCDECNMGKGAWDETDHRSESERLIADQLRAPS